MTADQQRVVETTLTNDENSTDEEMIEYFVSEVGITEDESILALADRGKTFVHKGNITS